MGADPPSEQPVPFDLLLEAIRSACRFHRGVEPEDVIGEVYLRLTRVLRGEPGKFRGDAHFTSYVHLIVGRILIEDHRRAGRHARVVDPSLMSSEATRAPADAVDLPSVEECLDALKDADPTVREVFRLHLEGLQGKDIGTRLGLKPWTVSRVLRDARDIIHERFPEYVRTAGPERSDP